MRWERAVRWCSDPPRRLRLAALVAVALAAVACAVGSPGGERPRRDPGSGGSATGRQPDPQEFEDDINGALAVADEYWKAEFAAGGRAFQPVRRVIAYRRDGEVSCGGEPMVRNNAAYCAAGDFIAYDVNWAVAAFDRIGDAFLYFLLGHEYAHGVQLRLQLRFRYTIEQELQADCLAGAYIGDSVRAGRLELEPGDLDELRTGLKVVGDDPGQPWFTPGAHGDADQRSQAFFTGYERSVEPCGLRL
jgi:predicted metalloprotease